MQERYSGKDGKIDESIKYVKIFDNNSWNELFSQFWFEWYPDHEFNFERNQIIEENKNSDEILYFIQKILNKCPQIVYLNLSL